MSLWSLLFRGRRSEPRPSVRPRLEALEGRLVFAVNITEFPATALGAAPAYIAAGPDGALWFTEEVPTQYGFDSPSNKIGRISTNGVVTEFTLPTSGATAGDITAGPDGALWFTDPGTHQIGRITTGGTITEFSVPGSDSLGSITAGPDGALWFTENGPPPPFSEGEYSHTIGRITTAGSVSEVSQGIGGTYNGITTGPDGALWFTESAYSLNIDVSFPASIGRITTSGSVTGFYDPEGHGSITAGPDGALWLAGYGNIGRITTGGVLSTFNLPDPNSQVNDITAGPDGALWFTEGNNIGRISTSGSITEFALPTADSRPYGIVTGPDGALWFTEFNTNRIGRLALPSANPAAFPLGANNGAGATPIVNLQAGGQVVGSATPFPGFSGDLRRATGFLHGDPIVVWAAGPSAAGGPAVKVVDAATGATLAEFFAFDPGFTGGVFVAVADVNNDGTPDIIVSAGAGGGPEVKVIDGTKLDHVNAAGEIEDSALLADFLAFAPSFTAGVTVAASDFNGDGHADLVVGAGPGGGSEVKVIDGTRLDHIVPRGLPGVGGDLAGEIENSALIADFLAFAPGFTGGVFVAAADVNGDRTPDLIAGAGAGSEVKVIDGTKLDHVNAAGEIEDSGLISDFLAFAPAFPGGVRVDAIDVNGDGKADLVVGAGPGGSPEVKVIDAARLDHIVPAGQPAAGEIEDSALLDDFPAQPGADPNGVFV